MLAAECLVSRLHGVVMFAFFHIALCVMVVRSKKKMYSAYDRNVAIECCGNSVIGVFDAACNRSGATPILMSFCVDALPSAATMYFRASNKM